MARTKQTAKFHEAGKHSRSIKALKKRPLNADKEKEKEKEKTSQEPEQQQKKFRHRDSFFFKRRVKEALAKQRQEDFMIYNHLSSVRQIKWSIYNTRLTEQYKTIKKDGKDQLVTVKNVDFRMRPRSVIMIHRIAAQITRDIMHDSKLTSTVDRKTTLQGKRLKANLDIWSKYNNNSFSTEVMELYKQVRGENDLLVEEEPAFRFV